MVEWVNATGTGALVLLCDHASNRVPRRLRQLGLEPAQLDRHIAWDPGAAAIARALSRLLDAPLLLSGYSRLVIDCNRPPASPESIAKTSDGVPIPGNRGLTPAQHEQRQREVFAPYHAAIAQLLDGRAARPTAVLSIHSFTPVLQGARRPWDLGISHRHDRGLGSRLLAALAAAGDSAELVIGDNQPYPIEDAYDHTLPTHAEARALPNCMIELRQDHLGSAAAVAAWASRLAEAYRRIERE